MWGSHLLWTSALFADRQIPSLSISISHFFLCFSPLKISNHLYTSLFALRSFGVITSLRSHLLDAYDHHSSISSVLWFLSSAKASIWFLFFIFFGTSQIGIRPSQTSFGPKPVVGHESGLAMEKSVLVWSESPSKYPSWPTPFPSLLLSISKKKKEKRKQYPQVQPNHLLRLVCAPLLLALHSFF